MHLLHEGQPATVMEGHRGITLTLFILEPSVPRPLFLQYNRADDHMFCGGGGGGRGMELILENREAPYLPFSHFQNLSCHPIQCYTFNK